MKFDESFFNEEVKCGFTITTKQKKIWADGLLLLEKFMEVCDRNRIRYFIGYGTLLGAVRHKGFIPWDYDIDLCCPRPEYEKLKNLTHEFTEPFELQFLSNDCNNYNGGYMKLRNSNSTGCKIYRIGDNFNGGGFIDIFPLDGVYEELEQRKLQGQKIEQFRRLLEAKIYGDNYYNYHSDDDLAFELFKQATWKYSDAELIDLFEQSCSECNYEKSTTVGNHAYRAEYENFYWLRQDFEQVVYLYFEGLKVPAPKNYDRCLRTAYGDYMEFPPVKIRGHHHNETLFDPDVPYKNCDFSRFLNIFDDMKSDEKIWLFGSGKIAFDYLKRYGNKYPPELILDNDKKKWGSNLFGIPIANPDEAFLCESKEKIRIIIATLYFEEIEKKLDNYGMNNRYIYLRCRKY